MFEQQNLIPDITEAIRNFTDPAFRIFVFAVIATLLTSTGIDTKNQK